MTKRFFITLLVVFSFSAVSLGVMAQDAIYKKKTVINNENLQRVG